ncbi:MAG: hypothetical protein OEL87_02840 [Nanoarchaeota archaeon]|nr:hypothetical protein [Nanoarchaeota archaeon]
MGKKKGDSVVKIDSGLLNSVEEFINLDKNKFKYVNKKQFIDIAVASYLRQQARGVPLKGIKRMMKNGK